MSVFMKCDNCDQFHVTYIYRAYPGKVGSNPKVIDESRGRVYGPGCVPRWIMQIPYFVYIPSYVSGKYDGGLAINTPDHTTLINLHDVESATQEALAVMDRLQRREDHHCKDVIFPPESLESLII